jgi:protein-S-isoprenylcysteine O-methyltransferase Ste14
MSLKGSLIVSSLFTYPALAALLFWPAGTLDWLAGWSFFVVFTAACVLLMRWLYVHNPSLLAERMRVGKNQKGWDKIFIALIYVLFTAWWVSMPLDAVRYQWSHMPLALRVLGVPLTLLSFYGLFATFRENPFLSGVVRIQDDRGHTVISTGPYRWVRHPMYAFAFLWVLGTPLWLGSWWGVIMALLFTALICVRAVLEERTLMRELPGYHDYARRVRHRIIPYVW